MSPEVEAPARGVQYALRWAGRPTREARLRGARVKYRARAEIYDDHAAQRRVELINRIILRMEAAR